MTHTFRASWPILRALPEAVLLAEAAEDLPSLAWREDARIIGPARFWIDEATNRVRAEAPARTRRIRRRDAAVTEFSAGSAEGRADAA